MFRRIAILAFAIAPIGASASAQPAPDKRIRQVMERPEFAHALWGMEFYDLGAKKTVSAVNRDRLFVPGSTTKLVSTGTALQLLGAISWSWRPVIRISPDANTKTGHTRSSTQALGLDQPNWRKCFAISS